ncbi:ATP-dependent DNA helicase [Variovorax sp. PCZ-1]|uniref:ATP-dependent DNA helicase n=1 Tax=Variovorax sp. PCZ-1 TaxID=2835533 RepID=UPI0020C17851|nr:ATP-dependent DNA helicase [Variovorax sp. PCZ-1]
MADAVAQTIESGGALVVEAGTGVGKTFAYLVPALLSGERVMVSTATKALQDQLFSRDLPMLLKALGLPARTALLKGRSSYLCIHRMKLARQEHVERSALLALAKIEKWAVTTTSGDLAELPGLDERSSIIPLVTSSRENCLGSTCPSYKSCHVMLARKQALAADVVVVNHHLFFADLAVRESGMAELLPTVRIAIFDEAHQLNETGVQFLGAALGTSQLLDFTRDLLGTGLQLARGLAEWQELARDCEMAARDLRLVVGEQTKYSKDMRLRWTGSAPEGLQEQDWAEGLSRVEDALQMAMAALDMVSEIAPDFVRLHERAREMASRAKRFLQKPEKGQVRWLDVGTQVTLMEAPLDIAQTIRTKLLKLDVGQGVNDFPPEDESRVEPDDEWQEWMPDEEDVEALMRGAPSSRDAAAAEPSRRAWIFTSATLGDDAKLSWFTEPCGLQDARILVAQSPFDYPNQASVYVPRHLPKPSDPTHSEEVAKLALVGAQRLQGRTMVLTTTLRALKTIGERLKHQLDGELEVLIQGQMSKRELVERFRIGNTQGGKGCVLVASASFWEGIDIPGEALQLVIIDKLPFPPPGDPLVEARCQRLESEGRSAFADYSVPEAAVALKQGAGRLIRRESDRGILVIGDTRLVQMGYGRRLMAALPPMARLSTPEDFQAALDQLSNEL